MKFMLNGAVTLGTWDGANIEIAECAGEENEYIFGARVEDIEKLKAEGYNPRAIYEANPETKRVIDTLDLPLYVDAKIKANSDYADRKEFGKKCLLNVANAGKFSSDRSILEYAKEIWHTSYKK